MTFAIDVDIFKNIGHLNEKLSQKDHFERISKNKFLKVDLQYVKNSLDIK